MPTPVPTDTPPLIGGQGLVYTRWGRTTCPSTPGTQLVYSGRAAGSGYWYYGAGSDILCMPDDPEYGDYGPGEHLYKVIEGIEYFSYSNQPLYNVLFHNMPCAVCCGNRAKVLMIPAKKCCPRDWQREYYGYLMATYNGDSFLCVDSDPESVPSQDPNSYSAHQAFHVEANCNGLDCPPYDPEKELTCVVCTN